VHLWKVILFLLPLGLDTFAVSAALGTRQPSRDERLRISLVMTGFEVAMPVIGLVLGRALGTLIGSAADYLAIAVLVAVGIWLLVGDDDDDEKAAGILGGSGVALFAVGLSISLDELAIGFSAGLIGVSIWVAIVLIGVQAYAAAQLGLRLGGRLSENARENAERLAGVALIALAVLLAVEKAV
jgi:manganese efflux pump family protein